ncbi:MAG TPA: ATP synthase F0 subunit B [Candidatus Binataceae bacterium]|nr:ATP synthase F0 subunit B [Candidatus Binataceae bacterium]
MLKAIPTILLFILVYWYLKAMLFRPLEKVLAERDALTEGAKRTAEASFAAAERKQKEYEAKFAEARAEVYKIQEETRRKWLEDQAAQLAETRKRMEESVHAAKAQIQAEAATARQGLEASSAQLAEEIASAILARRSSAA